MSNLKFNIGDKVRIVDYGHLVWTRANDGEVKWIDISPEIVGNTGVINERSNTGGYSLDVDDFKSAWYSHEQLELVKDE